MNDTPFLLERHVRPGAALLAALLAVTPAVGLAVDDCVKTTSAKKTLEIHVNDEGTPYFTDKACNRATSNNGDVCYDKQQRAQMRFKLMGNESQNWELEAIELSSSSTVFPSPGMLPLGAYSDFEFDTDAGLKAGRPYVELSNNRRTMDVRNNNCHAFTVYYQVLLKDPDGNPVTLHPIIENSGTGR